MADVSYEAFLSYLLPYAPGVPEPQAIPAIRNACIEFCAQTLILQAELDPISTLAGEATYEIEAGAGYQPVHVVQLYYQNRLLQKRSPLEVEKLYSRNWRALLGAPQFYMQPAFDEVTFVPVPDKAEADSITGRIAVTPTRASLKVDDQLLGRYAEAISDGALGRLLTTPNQAYTDVKAAQFYMKRFGSAVANVQAYVATGLNRAPMRVRFNRVW